MWSDVSLAFCNVVLLRAFAYPNNVNFHQENFYLGSKVLFRLLPLSSLLEFTVFSEFNLSLTLRLLFTDLMMYRR